MDDSDRLRKMIPLGSRNAEAILEYLKLLEAYARRRVSEADLVAHTRAIESDAAAVSAFVSAFCEINDRTFDDFETVRFAGATPADFLEWALISCGELRGFLMDKPRHLHSRFMLVSHGDRSSCFVMVFDDDSRSFLWDSAVFPLKAPVLALATVSLYCESSAFYLREEADMLTFSTVECLRDSVSAREALV